MLHFHTHTFVLYPACTAARACSHVCALIILQVSRMLLRVHLHCVTLRVCACVRAHVSARMLVLSLPVLSAETMHASTSFNMTNIYFQLHCFADEGFGHVVFTMGSPGINFLQLIPFSVLFKFMAIAVHLKLKASLT